MWIEDDIENNDEDEPWKAKMSPPAHLAPANAAITLPLMVNMDQHHQHYHQHHYHYQHHQHLEANA